MWYIMKNSLYPFIFEDVFHQKPFHFARPEAIFQLSVTFYEPSKLNSPVIQLQWFRLSPHILSVLAHCRDQQSKLFAEPNNGMNRGHPLAVFSQGRCWLKIQIQIHIPCFVFVVLYCFCPTVMKKPLNRIRDLLFHYCILDRIITINLI